MHPSLPLQRVIEFGRKMIHLEWDKICNFWPFKPFALFRFGALYRNCHRRRCVIAIFPASGSLARSLPLARCSLSFSSYFLRRPILGGNDGLSLRSRRLRLSLARPLGMVEPIGRLIRCCRRRRPSIVADGEISRTVPALLA